MKKVKFTFAKAPPDNIDIPGLLHKRVDHTEIELTLINTTDEQIEDWAKKNNAVDYDDVDMNLEDQFIEYTEPVNHKRLFQWEVNQK